MNLSSFSSSSDRVFDTKCDGLEFVEEKINSREWAAEKRACLIAVAG